MSEEDKKTKKDKRSETSKANMKKALEARKQKSSFWLPDIDKTG